MMSTLEDQANEKILLLQAKTELEKRFWNYIERGWSPKTSLHLSLEDVLAVTGTHPYPAGMS